MGAYCYKTTANTVTLANGEKANVAIFAYKPNGFASYHTKSGAAAADRAAADGKRLDWVVLGNKDDATGEIHVVEGAEAYKVGPRGSFMDTILNSDRLETSTVVDYDGARGKLRLHRESVEYASRSEDHDEGWYVTKLLTKGQWHTVRRRHFVRNGPVTRYLD